MKFLVAELMGIVSQKQLQRNVRLLVRYLLVVLASVAIYSVLFHVLMEREGRDFSWLTGVYWTLMLPRRLGDGHRCAVLDGHRSVRDRHRDDDGHRRVRGSRHAAMAIGRRQVERSQSMGSAATASSMS